MNNPITVPLPQDLPTNWTYGQTVAPNGSEVGMAQQYGYNYLMAQVNAAQKAVMECGENFANAAEIVVPAASGNFASLDAEGNLQDSGKTAADFAPAPLTKNLTLYVNAATGSDSNDGLTTEQPKKTIMAAINAIPKNLGGYSAKVNIADGTYPESVDINGFYGSNRGNLYGVQLVGTSQETVSITGGIAAMGCRAPLLIQGVSVSRTNSGNVVSFRQCGIVTILTTSVDGQPVVSNGAAVFFESTNGVLRELKVDNCPGMAVGVTGGTAYIQVLSGENNEIGVQAGNSAYGFPGLVVVGTNTMTANTKYSKVLGGAIIENGALL